MQHFWCIFDDLACWWNSRCNPWGYANFKWNALRNDFCMKRFTETIRSTALIRTIMKTYYQVKSLKIFVCWLCANWMQITKTIILKVLFPFTPQFCFSSVNLYVNSSEMLRNGIASYAKKYTFVFDADLRHSFL